MNFSLKEFEHLKDGFEVLECKMIVTNSKRQYVLWGSPLRLTLIHEGREDDPNPVVLIGEKQIKCIVCDARLTIKYMTNSCGCHFHMSCMKKDIASRKQMKCKCGHAFDNDIKARLTISKKKEKKSQA